MRIRCGIKLGPSELLYLMVPPLCGVIHFDSENRIFLGFFVWDEMVGSPETVRVGLKRGVFFNECVIRKNENHSGMLSFLVTKNVPIEDILASYGYKTDIL